MVHKRYMGRIGCGGGALSCMLWLLTNRAFAQEADVADDPVSPAPAQPPAEAPPEPPAGEVPPKTVEPPLEVAPVEPAETDSPPPPPPADEPPLVNEQPVEDQQPDADDGVVVQSGAGLFEEAISDQSSEAVVAEAEEPVRGFELGGYVRGDMFAGKASDADRAQLAAGYAELALELRVPTSRWGSAFAETRLRYGQQGDERDLFVDLREAYVNLYAGPLDLRLGKQIVVWGRADGFNPTNNLTPIDLRVRSPIEDDRRIANVGARAFLSFSPLRLEGVWMPLYTPTEFPPVELPERVRLVESDFPSTELQDGLGAARAHLELPAFEMSVSYLYGHALLPGLALEGFSVGEAAEVRLRRTAYRHQVLGADFSTALEDLFAVRAEVAYKKPYTEPDLRTPNPELNYVLGLDRAFGTVHVIAQYIGKYVEDWQPEAGPDDPLDFEVLTGIEESDLESQLVVDSIVVPINQELALRNQILFQQTEELQHLASLRIEWLTLHETLSLSAFGLLNFSTEEWLLYPKLAYKLSDAVSVSVGGELYNGPGGTLLDLLDEKLTAGYVEMRHGF